MRSTGTVKGVATWIRSQRAAMRESSSLELHAMGTMSESALIASWVAMEALEDPDAHAELVVASVDADVEGRGVTTRYELRHVRDERTRGVTQLRRVVADKGDDAQPETYDPSTAGLVAMLMKSQREAYAVVLDSSRAAAQTQQALLGVLHAAYASQAQLQAQLQDLRNELAEAKTTARAGESLASTAVREAMTVFGPEIAKYMLGQGPTGE